MHMCIELTFWHESNIYSLERTGIATVENITFRSVRGCHMENYSQNVAFL